MRFTKMQGCGNDYVYVDLTHEEVPPEPRRAELVRQLSDRHFGIGGDGVIFIDRPADGNADFEMIMYNADGTRAEMCGNGIRCVAKFVYDKGLTKEKEITIESMGAQKYLTLTVDPATDTVSQVRVDMGAPILTPAQIPLALPGAQMAQDQIVDHPITIEHPAAGFPATSRMTCVSMGNPHAVILLPSGQTTEDLPLAEIGPQFEHHAFFPKRTNTEFVQVVDRSHVRMRVWERGTGETLACGTGCCATTVACILNGVTDRHVTVQVLGGAIDCEWDEKTGHVFMTGPAVTAFEGTIDLR
ncbi:MAG: diaminopimelate epimerase [Butyrivibrio sp.]|nr:diaminopimelate epimerase [Butyrivibrio sp.]